MFDAWFYFLGKLSSGWQHDNVLYYPFGGSVTNLQEESVPTEPKRVRKFYPYRKHILGSYI